MSEFFPTYKSIKVNKNVELLAFTCQDTVFQLAYIAPGASFPLHQHPESQMGMMISGDLEMNVNGKKEFLKPFQQVYSAGTNVPHGSENYSNQTVFCFDVKRLVNSPNNNEELILDLLPTIEQNTNLPCQKAISSWFEIIVTKIPGGSTIPSHKSNHHEIGVILNGQMMMNIADENKHLQKEQVYFVPSNTIQKGYNPVTEEVTLIKIKLPMQGEYS